MNSKMTAVFVVILGLFCSVAAMTTVSTFEELAAAHCRSFPIDLLYRLSTGRLSEIYGREFRDIDCYIRQFVNQDGQDTFEQEQSQQQDQEEQSGAGQEQEEIIPDIDPLVIQYAKGLSCLPDSTDPVQAVYAIWRFYRFVIQHDYILQWMRAKVRATLGYEAEKPNAWMDGQQSAPRLRLEKLFSNQFYEYIDQLMFKEFLHPVITFFKRNTVFAAAGQITASGKPILVQFIENKNLLQKIFQPIVFQHTSGNIFTYTLPGIPLLLGGTTNQLSWAFTGVLTDRSNIQQIQTLGNKFFHHGSETWIKLQNVSLSIKIKDSQPSLCNFMHSNYGTLYEKHKSIDGGKVSEYIARWHEKEKKVRVVFSQLFELIINDGKTTKDLQFPFNSLVLTNETGIFHYICFQKHPSYFLYPDLAGAPQTPKEKWSHNFKRNFLVVSNTHLTTQNQESYIKKEIQTPVQQQFLMETRRRLTKGKFTPQSLLQFTTGLNTDPLIKKRKELLIYIYRKTKFLLFPEESVRKECDQIIAMLEKWDDNLNSRSISPAFILWDYFFREYTFSYVSSFPLGRFVARHKIVTDNYWTNQMDLWKVGTSYGQCDNDLWNQVYKQKLNGTGDNSSCYLNVIRGINVTRQILRDENGVIRQPLLADYLSLKKKDLSEGYVGSHLDQAFYNYYSKNLAFAAEIGNPSVIFYEGFEQDRKEINLQHSPQPPIIDKQKLKQNPSITEMPISGQPITKQPITKQPITQQPITQQPITVQVQTITVQPNTVQPINEQPINEQPLAEQL